MKYTLAILAIALANCFLTQSQVADTSDDDDEDPFDFLEIASTDPNDVQFFLYPNPDNTDDVDQIVLNDTSSLSKSRYNSALPSIYLIHDFTENYTSPNPVVVRNAYLGAGYATTNNIIVVNWGPLAQAKGQLPIPVPPLQNILSIPIYGSAVANVFIAGRRLKEFIQFLPNGGQQVQLVGQGLGAQLAGMAGYYYKQDTRKLLSRITGTDPNAPGFQNAIPNFRLSPASATFVDVIHTNEGGWGYSGDIGTVDFRVNNPLRLLPQIQPTCVSIEDILDAWCSHNLASQYFAQSIANSNIKACPDAALLPPSCTTSNQITFGQNVPLTARGEFKVNL